MDNFNAKNEVILSNWILHNQSSPFHVNIPIYIYKRHMNTM